VKIRGACLSWPVLNSPDARLLEAAMFLATMAAQPAVLGRRATICSE
jgi:hypothetical protein